MDPVVSCCIITYNHATYIVQAIESVLNQKHSYPMEIIIADDCSTDGTTEIVNYYKKKYPALIRVITQQKNIGAAQNFMQLLKAATGNYIAYLEGDDYWNNDAKLQMQIDFLETHDDFVICFGNVLETFSEDPADKRNFMHGGSGGKIETSLNDLLYCNYVQTASVVFKNKLFPYFPAWYGSLMPGDWPLHILNARFGKIFFIDVCMCVHRNHSDGVWNTQKAIKKIEHSLHICKVIGKELNLATNKFLKMGKTRLLLSSIKFLLKEKKYVQAIKNLCRAFLYHPLFFLKREI